MSNQSYGVFIEDPGNWVGFCALVVNGEKIPMAFCEVDAEKAADNARAMHPAAKVSVRKL